VIIPTYNRAEFLRACLASLQRSGAPGMEVIVVDDGSTDDIKGVAAASKLDCVYLRQDNKGPAAARNLGFKHSHGRYVAFLDSDDQWLPDVPGQMIQLLDRNPEIDLLFADARVGNDDEGFQSWIHTAGEAEFERLPSRNTECGVRIFEKEAFFRRMAVRNPVFIGAVIMRREAFARAGMFDTELCGAADWELWLRMASQMTFAFCPQPMSIYTRHGACMSNDHDVMRDEFARALAKVRQKSDTLTSTDRNLIERQLRNHLFGHAYAAYCQGNLALARQRLGRLRKSCGLSAFECLFFGFCMLPPSLAKLLRQIWRARSARVSS
jgi:glycosyltransferase involved in cell wall biosynthesis